MERAPPSERTKAALRKLPREGSEDLKSDLTRLSMRRVVEEALEAAAEDILARGYYERRGPDGEGDRNGNREGRLKTSEGEVTYAVPEVREVSPEPINRIREYPRGDTKDRDAVFQEQFMTAELGTRDKARQERPAALCIGGTVCVR